MLIKCCPIVSDLRITDKYSLPFSPVFDMPHLDSFYWIRILIYNSINDDEDEAKMTEEINLWSWLVDLLS